MGRFRTTRLGVALATLIALPIDAQVIDFEDLAPANDSQSLIADEYAHLGAHFVASDDGATWSGLGASDPGRWEVEGTNGSTFLGFDGRSYAISVRFDTPIEAFQIDVARAAGALPFLTDIFQVTGFLQGQRVESQAVFLGGVDDWKTVSLSATVDKVTWFGTGLLGHRFAVDNLRWVGLAPSTTVTETEIDVLPGSVENHIHLHGRGVVPVVLYGEEAFAVEDVDVETLAFGPDGAGVAHRNGPHFEDVDGDELLDMVVHHRVAETGIAVDDVEACLTGETVDGLVFEGCDLVAPHSRRR